MVPRILFDKLAICFTKVREWRRSLIEIRSKGILRGIDKDQPVAQRQERVSGTLALLDSLSEAAFHVSRASAPKGDEVL